MVKVNPSRLNAQTVFPALLLTYLSIAVLLMAPNVILSLVSTKTAVEDSSNQWKPDTTSEMMAATASLQSGHGPLGTGPISCSPGVSTSAYCKVGRNALAISTSADGWTNITSTAGFIFGAPGGSMAYDGADNYVVYFEGGTWKFSGGSWAAVSGTGPSNPHLSAAMTYDAADGYVLLFGGIGLFGISLGDTWKYSAGVWTNITSSVGPGPSARGLAAMTYDAADSYVLLFGGAYTSSGNSRFLGDTWKYSAGVWTNITSSVGPGPSGRGGAAMTYDGADAYVLLSGGNRVSAGGFGALSDTWRFSAGAWTNITSSAGPGPSARYSAAMTYDVADRYVVLFGGQTSYTSVLGDTWKFSGGTWTNITSSVGSGPSARSLAAMTYDAADGYVLLFSGYRGIAISMDTWTFSALSTPPSFGFSLSTPSPSSLTVVQGGTSPSSSITATLSTGTTVPLTFSVSDLLTGISATFTNNACSPTCTVTVSFMATSTATLGTDGVIINALGGGVSHSTTLSLTIASPVTQFDYSLSVSPTSTIIIPGSTFSFTITARLTSSATQPINILGNISPVPTVCQPSPGSPPGTSPCGSVTISPPSITPSLNGAISRVTVSTTPVLPTGTYTFRITGSPTGSSSSSTVFTAIVTPPQDIVGCGQSRTCSIQSNATLSNIRFAGVTIHIEAAGPTGGHAYANVTVPRTAIPDINNIRILVDNSPIRNSCSSCVTITSNSTDYFIYFTFTFHSPVLIDILLTASENVPNLILGLDPTLFYEIVGAAVAAIIIVSAAILVRRRGRTRVIGR